MLKLRRKNMDPRTGWTYFVENGFEIKAATFDKLVAAVRDHLHVNGQPIPPNLADVIEDDICRRNPQSMCSGDGPQRHFPTAKEIESMTRRMIDLVRSIDQDSFVTQQQAESRAAVCLGCPMKRNVWSCFGCASIIKLVTKTFKRTTPFDRNLYACGVCKCLNAAQVHLKPEMLARTTPLGSLGEYPAHCWKKQELERRYGNP